MRAKMIGIYQIRNQINGKIYVGQSLDIVSRLRAHRHYLRMGNHDNGHLQNAWNKYGEGAFLFGPIMKCASSDLAKFEQTILDTTTRSNLYNIGMVATSSRKGLKHRKESIELMRKAHMGKTPSRATRQLLRETQKGRKASAEARKNMSRAAKGKGNGFFGKIHSIKSRKQMSEGRKGKKNSRFGKTISVATREKISKSLKIYWRQRNNP